MNPFKKIESPKSLIIFAPILVFGILMLFGISNLFSQSDTNPTPFTNQKNQKDIENPSSKTSLVATATVDRTILPLSKDIQISNDKMDIRENGAEESITLTVKIKNPSKDIFTDLTMDVNIPVIGRMVKLEFSPEQFPNGQQSLLSSSDSDGSLYRFTIFDLQPGDEKYYTFSLSVGLTSQSSVIPVIAVHRDSQELLSIHAPTIQLSKNN